MVYLDGKNLQTIQPSKKLDNRRFGPYRIKREIGKFTYELDLPKSMRIHPVFPISLLFPKPTDEYAREPEPLPPVVTPEGEEEYEVEKILGSQKRGKRLEYYIKWKGYGQEENTWEPKANLANSPELVCTFHQSHPNALGP
jgi:hypothetical protein